MIDKAAERKNNMFVSAFLLKNVLSLWLPELANVSLEVAAPGVGEEHLAGIVLGSVEIESSFP